MTCQKVLLSVLNFCHFSHVNIQQNPNLCRCDKKGGIFKWDTAIVFHFNKFDTQLKDVHLVPVLPATGNKH